MHPVRIMLCLLLAAAVVRPAASAAENDDLVRAKARHNEAARQYDLMEYEGALEGFREAYRLAGDPVFLFNIAQCHRKLGHTQEALTFYKNYLRRKPDAANRDEVERRIEELEKAESTQIPAPAPGPAPEKTTSLVAAPVVPQPAPQPATTPTGIDVSAASAPQAEPARTPVYKTWWFWTAAGTVVAGGVVAALLLTMGKDSGAFCADCNTTTGIKTQ